MSDFSIKMNKTEQWDTTCIYTVTAMFSITYHLCQGFYITNLCHWNCGDLSTILADSTDDSCFGNLLFSWKWGACVYKDMRFEGFVYECDV